MVTVMKQAIDIDEHISNEKDEKLECLLTENRGLRELLNIKNKYNVNYEKICCNSKEDKDVQTTPLDELISNSIVITATSSVTDI